MIKKVRIQNSGARIQNKKTNNRRGVYLLLADNQILKYFSFFYADY
jgi:hypothetical protein